MRVDTFIPDSGGSRVNAGLPPLESLGKPVSFFEFWPAWVLYVPVAVYWILLGVRYRSFGLPMLVNPEISLGGMVGESKADILSAGGDVAQRFILPFVQRTMPAELPLKKCDECYEDLADNDLDAMEGRGIRYPCVMKPELGCRGAGVRVISGRGEHILYLKSFPLDRSYLIQQLAPYTAEAGVFYERLPGSDQGDITSITLKYRPVVIGNGRSSLKSLILADPRASILRRLYLEKNHDNLGYIVPKGEEYPLSFAGSHCKGSIFKNGNSFITESMRRAIDAVMKDFPSFHYGRLDIKFESLDVFQTGRNFVVIEINGVSSEKTHIWDSRTSLLQAMSTLLAQYRCLFQMGDQVRRKGRKVPSIITLVKTWLRELKQSDNYPQAS